MPSLAERIRSLFRRDEIPSTFLNPTTGVDSRPEARPNPNKPSKTQQRYPHPRIYAIDCEKAIIQTLEDRGYRVSTGTLGVPYRIPSGEPRNVGFPKLFATGDLGGIDEEEIVLVDLAAVGARQPIDLRDVDQRAATGYVTEWPTNGIVDPRPLLAWDTMPKVDQILAHGGVVIAFVGPPLFTSYARPGSYLETTSFSGASVDGILGRSALDLSVSDSIGREVRIVNDANPVSAVLARHRDAATYSHKLEPGYRQLDAWKTVATNKYNEAIAGVLAPNTGGTIILLPQFGDRNSVVVREIIEQALPSITPDLVPHLVNPEWLNEPSYLLPSIKTQLDALTNLESEYLARRAPLETALETARQKAKPVQDLLVAADRELVVAAHEVLRDEVGFNDVIDADTEKRNAAAVEKDLREDLRVPSTSPVLLIEVKGIGGGGKDEDMLQIEKAVTLHSTEQPNLKFKGVTILNNQRSRPPLERDEGFLRDDLAKILRQKGLALITTWDLYRLVMNRQTHGWPTKALQDVFFRSGRIEPVPAHYEEVGRVIQYYPQPRAIIIQLSATLAVGDRISFERPVLYYEETVLGIRIDNADVSSGAVGEEIGIISSIPKEDARRDMRVFRAKTSF